MPRFALIIGNSSYEDSALSKLAAPDVDVPALAGVLKDPAIGQFDDVIELRDQPCSTVRREVARFFNERRRDDLLLLYFSGHGVRDDQGHLYLAVRDTEHSLLTGTAVEASFIAEQMDRCRSKRQVLVLDCCHSGAFERGAKAMLGESVGTVAAFEGNGFGRVVLTATDSTQVAFEGDRIIGGVENSLFTHFIIQGLKTGNADLDRDGVITVDELYDYVYEKVITETPRQTPGKSTYKQQGDIVVARNCRAERTIEGPPITGAVPTIPAAGDVAGGLKRDSASLPVPVSAPEAATLSWLRSRAVRYVAFVALAAAIAFLAIVEINRRTPPPVDPDAIAREFVSRAQVLYERGHVMDGISYLEGVQPPHPLIAATITLWRSKLSDAERDRHAEETVASARKLFASGGRADAIAQLKAFQPAHPSVTAALADLTGQVEALAQTAVSDAQKLRANGQVKEAIALLERFQPELPAVSEALRGLRAQIAADSTLDQLRGSVRTLIRQGKLSEALSATRAGIKAQGADPRLSSLVDEIQGAAQRLAVLARQSAESVQGARDRPAFGQAAARLQSGDEARRAGRPDDALRDYDAAVTLYDQAREQAFQETVKRKPDDRAAIQSVLQQFQAAYNARNVDGLKAVYQMHGNVEQGLRASLGGMRTVTWTYDDIVIEIKGDDATAVCRVRIVYVPDRGQPFTQTQTRRFTLRRSGATWTIVNLEVVK